MITQVLPDSGDSMYDMVALAGKLIKIKHEVSFARDIIDAVRLKGIIFDLERAQTAIKALVIAGTSSVRIPEPLGHYTFAIEAALFTDAVILYVKSTVSAGKPAPYDPVAVLNSEQRRKHQLLKDLRNEALAHRGAGTHPTGSQMHDGLIVDPNQGYRIGFYGRRSRFRQGVIQDLEELIPIAISSVEKKLSKREVTITERLHFLLKADKLVANLLHQYPFDQNSDEGSYHHPHFFGVNNWVEPAKL